MNAYVNWIKRHEGFRFQPQSYGRNYATLMDYEKNSLFGYGYGNYSYQPYQPQHNNFFGKLLGFGAVAALGYGIGQSGGIIPFFNKIGGFLNKIFGHKEERREDLGDMKRLESRPIGQVTSSQQQPASKNDIATVLKSRMDKEYTVIPTEHGLQLPEVVVTAKRINNIKAIPLTKIETQQPKIDIAKLTASMQQQAPTQQPPVQQAPTKQAPVANQLETASKYNVEREQQNALDVTELADIKPNANAKTSYTSMDEFMGAYSKDNKLDATGVNQMHADLKAKGLKEINIGDQKYNIIYGEDQGINIKGTVGNDIIFKNNSGTNNLTGTTGNDIYLSGSGLLKTITTTNNK